MTLKNTPDVMHITVTREFPHGNMLECSVRCTLCGHEIHAIATLFEGRKVDWGISNKRVILPEDVFSHILVCRGYKK